MEKQELNVLVTQQKESLEASMCESKELRKSALMSLNKLYKNLKQPWKAKRRDTLRLSRDHDSFKAGTESRR